MLSQATITTMLPVKDMERARSFYEGKLGFQPDGGARVDGRYEYRGDGARIALIPREGGPRAEHTALSCEVRDIRCLSPKSGAISIAGRRRNLTDPGPRKNTD